MPAFVHHRIACVSGLQASSSVGARLLRVCPLCGYESDIVVENATVNCRGVEARLTDIRMSSSQEIRFADNPELDINHEPAT